MYNSNIVFFKKSQSTDVAITLRRVYWKIPNFKHTKLMTEGERRQLKLGRDTLNIAWILFYIGNIV